jgi:hypothetical protein
VNTTHVAVQLPAVQWLGVALNVGLTVAASWYSFDFGVRVGGVFVGVLAAVNGAVMCSLLVSGLMERIARLFARR